MADYHWRGQLISLTAAGRDRHLASFRDFVDGVLGVQEYPDNTYQSGLATQSNRQGDVISGPSFTWSIKVPEDEFSMPPDGTGRVNALEVSFAGDDDSEATHNYGPIE